MAIILNDGVVIQAYNNNTVCIKMLGKEKILFSKGIGFGKKFGDKIPKGTKVEKIFIMENEENIKNFKQVVEKVDDDFFDLCEKIITEISRDLNEDLDERIYVGLIDHLNFSIKRINNNETIDNPFLDEIKVLYKTEYMIAKKVVRMIMDRINISIPDGEVGLIALHIHSNRNSGKLQDIIKSTNISKVVLDSIEKELKIKIPRDSLNYARFITHIKFAVKRIISNSELENDFIEEIKSKYTISYKIAKDTAKILEKYLDKKVCEDEIAYLAMHVERFRICV